MTATAPGEGQASLSPLSLEVVGCSQQLDDLVMSLLADDPEYRPGGATEVLERIKTATGIAVKDDEVEGTPRQFDTAELEQVIQGVMDPLWSDLCQRGDFTRYLQGSIPATICAGKGRRHMTPSCSSRAAWPLKRTAG